MKEQLCLLEKKLGDKRFCKTERAIVAIYLKWNSADASVLARRARISRATFYRHHRSVGRIAEDYEGLLRVRLERKFGRAGGVPHKKIHQDLLLFILQNRDLFDFLVVRGRKSPFYLLMGSVKGAISSEKRLLGNEMIYQVYAAEIVVVLTAWQRQGFDEKKMGAVLENMMFLTETAGIRLSPLKGLEEEKKK